MTDAERQAIIRAYVLHKQGVDPEAEVPVYLHGPVRASERIIINVLAEAEKLLQESSGSE